MRRVSRPAAAVTAALVAVALIAVVLVVGGSTSPSQTTGPTPEAVRQPSATPGALVESDPAVSQGPPAAPQPTVPPMHVTAPDRYARHLADLVLAVDTRHANPAALRRALRAEADPGLSPSGLADLHTTIDARVPADELWQRMRANAQWSTWEPTRTWEPAAWAQVVTAGHARPGWTMRNVTGIQTTNYQDTGETRSTSRETTLPLALRCPAAGNDLDRCWLLLISSQPVF